MSEELWEVENYGGLVVHRTERLAGRYYGMVEEFTYTTYDPIYAHIMRGGVIVQRQEESTLDKAKEWCLIELMKRKVLA